MRSKRCGDLGVVKALIFGVFLVMGVYFPSLQVLHCNTAFLSGCQLRRGLREVFESLLARLGEEKKVSLTLKVWTQLPGGLRVQDRGQEVARSSIERSFIEFCTQNRGLLTSSSSSGPDGDLPDADQVVCVASKQGLRKRRGKKGVRAGEAAK